MSHSELFEKMAQSVIDGDKVLSKELAEKSLELEIPPLESIDEGFVKGIRAVGDAFGRGELFLPQLVLSAEAMKSALAVLEPELGKDRESASGRGFVLAGTVKGDIHDIGKRIVCTMLAANGFKILDLGVNVKIETFVEKVKELKPDIVGMSALLTTTMPNQGKTIEALKEAGLRDQVIVLVGGAPTSNAWADKIGADGTASNATKAVELAIKLMEARKSVEV